MRTEAPFPPTWPRRPVSEVFLSRRQTTIPLLPKQAYNEERRYPAHIMLSDISLRIPWDGQEQQPEQGKAPVWYEQPWLPSSAFLERQQSVPAVCLSLPWTYSHCISAAETLSKGGRGSYTVPSLWAPAMLPLACRESRRSNPLVPALDAALRGQSLFSDTLLIYCSKRFCSSAFFQAGLSATPGSGEGSRCLFSHGRRSVAINTFLFPRMVAYAASFPSHLFSFCVKHNQREIVRNMRAG